VAWRGVAWRGVAWRGVAWRGVAWRGVAWRGVGRGWVRAFARAPARVHRQHVSFVPVGTFGRRHRLRRRLRHRRLLARVLRRDFELLLTAPGDARVLRYDNVIKAVRATYVFTLRPYALPLPG
jgi:hypothetical protein